MSEEKKLADDKKSADKKAKVNMTVEARKKAVIYDDKDSDVQMPLSMITTKAAFEKIWGRKFRQLKDLEDAWKRAEKFKSKKS